MDQKFGWIGYNEAGVIENWRKEVFGVFVCKTEIRSLPYVLDR